LAISATAKKRQQMVQEPQTRFAISVASTEDRFGSMTLERIPIRSNRPVTTEGDCFVAIAPRNDKESCHCERSEAISRSCRLAEAESMDA
jgi:seryl-tRNA(Sec) selenium transferase